MINVQERGVGSDGASLVTDQLQGLIDEAVAGGGGTLLFPAGTYVTGTLRLGDHVHLHFERGAQLWGSLDLEDYPLMEPAPVRFSEDQEGLRALIFAHGARGIALTGLGCIDGRGAEIHRPEGVRASMPRNIWFGDCQDVQVMDLHLRCSGFWMQHYVKCRGLKISGVKVFNHGSCNNDGLDIDGCSDVILSDLNIDSHDDAICLKSGNRWPTENVVITNCITRSHCNHFKTGTDSNGGFRNIRVSNLQMLPSVVRESEATTEGADYRGACGIALGCVDGGMMENISVSNVQMDQVRVPFFIKLGDRGTPIHGSSERQTVKYAKKIHLSDVVATRAGPRGCYIMGLPEQYLEDVILNNISLEFEGGGKTEWAEAPVELKREAYPSCDAFGYLPSFGCYMRHVDKIRWRNVVMKTLEAEPRPALRYQAVKNISIDGLIEEQSVS